MHFIIKLFPEITIKSAPVRKRFIKQLRDNLRYLISEIELPEGAKLRVQREWDKIEVISDLEDDRVAAQISEVLAHTPGIGQFAQVRRFTLGDMDDTYQKTQSVWGEALTGKTFCVRVKRKAMPCTTLRPLSWSVTSAAASINTTKPLG